MTSTEPVRYTANPKPGIRPRRRHAGATERYSEALAYLKHELRTGEFVSISTNEFASAFKINSSFITAVCRLKGIERQSSNNRQGLYRKLPKLDELTPEGILDSIRLDDQQSVRADKSADPTTLAIPFEDAKFTGWIAEVSPEASKTYVIGHVIEGEICVAADNKFEAGTEDEARDILHSRTLMTSGMKYALLQVVEVVQPSLVLQPSTL